MEVSIRDAVTGDLTQLSLLINELGYPTSAGEMKSWFNLISRHPDYKTLVAVVDGEIAGLAGLCKGLFYEMNGKYMRILVFIVKQDNRKKGIGKMLISAAEAWAAEQGLQSVFINCGNRPERHQAHKFYSNMGYSIKSSGYFKPLL